MIKYQKKILSYDSVYTAVRAMGVNRVVQVMILES